jgi:hypothetical protein
MFAALAYFCLVLFPETHKSGVKTHRKILRNRVYRVCGIIIVITMAIKAVDAACEYFIQKGFLWDVGTYCVEATMVIAFGVSWAVKGESFPRLND